VLIAIPRQFLDGAFVEAVQVVALQSKPNNPMMSERYAIMIK
jgi:hypothetical protein